MASDSDYDTDPSYYSDATAAEHSRSQQQSQNSQQEQSLQQQQQQSQNQNRNSNNNSEQQINENKDTENDNNDNNENNDNNNNNDNNENNDYTDPDADDEETESEKDPSSEKYIRIRSPSHSNTGTLIFQNKQITKHQLKDYELQIQQEKKVINRKMFIYNDAIYYDEKIDNNINKQRFDDCNEIGLPGIEPTYYEGKAYIVGIPTINIKYNKYKKKWQYLKEINYHFWDEKIQKFIQMVLIEMMQKRVDIIFVGKNIYNNEIMNALKTPSSKKYILNILKNKLKFNTDYIPEISMNKIILFAGIFNRVGLYNNEYEFADDDYWNADENDILFEHGDSFLVHHKISYGYDDDGFDKSMIEAADVFEDKYDKFHTNLPKIKKAQKQIQKLKPSSNHGQIYYVKPFAESQKNKLYIGEKTNDLKDDEIRILDEDKKDLWIDKNDIINYSDDFDNEIFELLKKDNKFILYVKHILISLTHHSIDENYIFIRKFIRFLIDIRLITEESIFNDLIHKIDDDEPKYEFKNESEIISFIFAQHIPLNFINVMTTNIFNIDYINCWYCSYINQIYESNGFCKRCYKMIYCDNFNLKEISIDIMG